MLDYKLIEALAMVAGEGGFDRAAKALCITQSAVSQRVKLLEELTGQVLIVRTTPPRTTSAGRKILKHYLQVKQLEQDLVGEMNAPDRQDFTPIAMGVNADSLAFWLLEAVHSFLVEEKVLLDIRVDDQEQTHEMLKAGEVMGCISTQEQPMQGCRVEYLGCMHYRLVATSGFADKWFPGGLTLEGVQRAPALIFDRNDALLDKLLLQAFGTVPGAVPAHYVPSVEKYAEFITRGHAYGSLPDQQSRALIDAGQMVDLLPGRCVSATLYWHCWNLKSAVLEKLTQSLIRKAKTMLEK
ncbi:MAG: LysR family transcriptional regulator ArgP [Desulfobacter sp.]